MDKQSLKDSTYYRSVKKRQGVDPITSVVGFPQTDWNYNDKDPANWSWSAGEESDDGLDDDTIEAMAMRTIFNGREREEPVAYREIADFTPWDASTCNRRFKKYEQQGEFVDLLQQAEKAIA